MRGKLPHDYTTQGSAFKAKKRDGDQTDIKGLRATVPAEEFMPEQQRAVAAAFPTRLHLCPCPAPAASTHIQGKSAAHRADAKPISPDLAHFRGLIGTLCLPSTGKAQARGSFHHWAPFSQSDLPAEGPEWSRRHTLCNLYVNELENMHKRAAHTLLQWIPPRSLWFLSEAYTDGVSAD